MKAVNKGFTLIELMIVVAIVAILAAIALPAYQTYTKKAKFTEIIQATSPYKTAVEVCIFKNGSETDCTAESNGVPSTDGVTGNYLSSITVTGGVITATGNSDVDDASFTLTPAVSNGAVTWTSVCTPADYC